MRWSTTKRVLEATLVVIPTLITVVDEIRNGGKDDR